MMALPSRQMALSDRHRHSTVVAWPSIHPAFLLLSGSVVVTEMIASEIIMEGVTLVQRATSEL